MYYSQPLITSKELLFVTFDFYRSDLNVWELKAVEEPALARRLGEEYVEHRFSCSAKRYFGLPEKVVICFIIMK